MAPSYMRSEAEQSRLEKLRETASINVFSFSMIMDMSHDITMCLDIMLKTSNQ